MLPRVFISGGVLFSDTSRCSHVQSSDHITERMADISYSRCFAPGCRSGASRPRRSPRRPTLRPFCLVWCNLCLWWFYCLHVLYVCVLCLFVVAVLFTTHAGAFFALMRRYCVCVCLFVVCFSYVIIGRFSLTCVLLFAFVHFVYDPRGGLLVGDPVGREPLLRRELALVEVLGPCESSLHRSNFNGRSPKGIQRL